MTGDDRMLRRNSRARLTAVALASLIAGAPLAADAQHVVTEDEASKLTLEALTAPPPRPVYRPIYRAYYRPAMSTRFEHRSHGWQRAVSHVSYRVAATHRTARRHRR